jgi:hypothetical protein
MNADANLAPTFRARLIGAKTSKDTPGKYTVEMEVLGMSGDREVPFFGAESAAVFFSVSDAEEAGWRAVQIFNSTGKFPNMCERF